MPFGKDRARRMIVDIDLSPLTILVIDDSRYARSFIKSALQSFGVRSILEGADGADGIEELRDHKVDLVLVDHDMSPMNGVEFTRFVRDGGMVTCDEIPIIMISGIAEMEKVIEARNSGVNEFLVKPVSADSLYRRIRNALTAPRPFVRTAAYTGPCRRTMERKPPEAIGERRRNPPLPRPKPLVAAAPNPPPGAAAQRPAASPRPAVPTTAPRTADKTSRKRFKAGWTIFKEGEPGDEAYVIETGKVAIFKEAEGRKVVLGHLGPQGVFGEMALIDGEPRMASAEAVDDTICLVIPKPALKVQLGKTPDLVILVLETLLQDIRKLGRELASTRAALEKKRHKTAL